MREYQPIILKLFKDTSGWFAAATFPIFLHWKKSKWKVSGRQNSSTYGVAGLAIVRHHKMLITNVNGLLLKLFDEVVSQFQGDIARCLKLITIFLPTSLWCQNRSIRVGLHRSKMSLHRSERNSSPWSVKMFLIFYSTCRVTKNLSCKPPISGVSSRNHKPRYEWLGKTRSRSTMKVMNASLSFNCLSHLPCRRPKLISEK